MHAWPLRPTHLLRQSVPHVAAFAATHAIVGFAGASLLAWQYADPASALTYLCTLGLVAMLVSTLCHAATTRYLAKRPAPAAAAGSGALCGSLPPVLFMLTFMDVSVSLAQFLAVFVPGLAAVALASTAGRREQPPKRSS